MIPAAAGEGRARETLTHLIDQFDLRRGNCEVDYPDMVEELEAMASGRRPVRGRFAAVAADQAYAFIEVTATVALALDQLARWAEDEHCPKCPLRSLTCTRAPSTK